VPMYAALIALLQWRKKQFFGQHLVFSLHFCAFWLTALFVGLYGGTSLVYRIAARRGVHLGLLRSDDFLFLIVMAILATYTVIAFRAVYRDSIIMAVFKSVVMVWALHYVLAGYRFVLFLIAFYSA